MSAELDRLAAEFATFQAKIKQAEQKFSGVVEMQDRIAELEATAISPDRTVRVVAGPGGAIKDIQVTPDALRLPATTLSETIMSTLRAAVAEAVRRQADVVDETVGDAFGLDTTGMVRQAQAEAMGTAEDEPASEPPRRTPPRNRGRQDDDFSQDSVFG